LTPKLQDDPPTLDRWIAGSIRTNDLGPGALPQLRLTNWCK